MIIHHGWEVEHGLDPLDPDDAWLDINGNGIPKLLEYLYGNDPNEHFGESVAIADWTGNGRDDVLIGAR